MIGEFSLAYAVAKWCMVCVLMHTYTNTHRKDCTCSWGEGKDSGDSRGRGGRWRRRGGRTVDSDRVGGGACEGFKIIILKHVQFHTKHLCNRMPMLDLSL
jgi:hypothetical protein